MIVTLRLRLLGSRPLNIHEFLPVRVMRINRHVLLAERAFGRRPVWNQVLEQVDVFRHAELFGVRVAPIDERCDGDYGSADRTHSGRHTAGSPSANAVHCATINPPTAGPHKMSG